MPSPGTPRAIAGCRSRPARRRSSTVTFDYSKYLDSVWHDGQPITLADAVYSIAQGFDIAYDPDKAAHRDRPGGDLAAVPRHLQGLPLHRRRPASRSMSTTGTSTTTTSRRTPTRPRLSMPWEVLAAMDDLVFDQRRAAYSDTAAARYDVPWLSLVHAPGREPRQPHAEADGLQGHRAGGRLRDGRQDLVTADEADGPLPGGQRLVPTLRPPGHQQRPVLPGRTTQPPSSRSWTPSGIRPIRSRPPTSSSVPRRRSRSVTDAPDIRSGHRPRSTPRPGTGHAGVALPARRPVQRAGGPEGRRAPPDPGQLHRDPRGGRHREPVPGASTS